MRILCLSENSLPDSRVEKSVITAIRGGHTVVFAGPPSPESTETGLKEVLPLPFNRRANLGLPPQWGRLKRAFETVLKKNKPDIIHAHNLVSGKLALESELPFVYDDHEFWSLILKAQRRSKWYHRSTQPYKRWLARRREDEVLNGASSVLVISKQMAKEHKKKNSRVQVIPNYPMKSESMRLRISPIPTKGLSSVYVGSDCSQPELVPYRNVSGLVDLFQNREVGELIVIGDSRLVAKPPVSSLGVLSHEKMMQSLTTYNIGLLPWKKHWVHSYANPNKPYEYAHAGLLNVSISDAVPVIETLGKYVRTFDDYDSLGDILTSYSDNTEEIFHMRSSIRQFALENLIWEKNEQSILKSYRT